MSITTTFGLVRIASATASSPVAASATISHSGSSTHKGKDIVDSSVSLCSNTGQTDNEEFWTENMAWATPAYTRGQVDAAGARLVAGVPVPNDFGVVSWP